jgi:hypothetical protein
MNEKPETEYLIHMHFCKPIVCQNPFALLFFKIPSPFCLSKSVSPYYLSKSLYPIVCQNPFILLFVKIPSPFCLSKSLHFIVCQICSPFHKPKSLRPGTFRLSLFIKTDATQSIMQRFLCIRRCAILFLVTALRSPLLYNLYGWVILGY